MFHILQSENKFNNILLTIRGISNNTRILLLLCLCYNSVTSLVEAVYELVNQSSNQCNH